MAKMPLHDVLVDIIGLFPNDNTDHCYFNPPSNIQLEYPCFVYNYTNDQDTFADNVHYLSSRRYTVTVIDHDEDSKIPSKLKERLPYCTSDRNFAVDGLSHFVHTLFYNGPRIKEE